MQEYYTYLDALERLRGFAKEQPPPPGALRADASPSRLTLTAANDADIPSVIRWLSGAFGPRFDSSAMQVLLESAQGAGSRTLAVDVARVDADDSPFVQQRLRPTLMKPRFVNFSQDYERTRVDDLSGCPAMMTFHSFKGGMGRTTLALALAGALVGRGDRVLFVDGDFEAPGVSTMLRHVMPTPRVAFSDLLSLAYADPDPVAGPTISLVRERLQDQLIDGMFVLPCTRDFDLPLVTPESLTFSSSRSAFFVGDLLARLGAALNVDAVIIDLRAGLSELGASLFLDPRLEHVLVTTLNGQAIDGTLALLEKMNEVATGWKVATSESIVGSVTVIINQVPTGGPLGEYPTAATSAMTALESELRKFVETRTPELEADPNPFLDAITAPIVIETQPNLLVLPRDIGAARKLLAESPLPRQMLESFADIVPIRAAAIQSPTSAGGQQRRKNLETYAREAVFAESGAKEEIFPTRALLNLVDRHQSALPTVVVLGDKGAGKTYTFMSLALSQTWSAFAARVSQSSSTLVDGVVLPVTPPQDLGDTGRARERAITESVARHFSRERPLGDQLIADAIEAQKASTGAESISSWRAFWLDLIAWRCGIRPREAGAFETLLEIPSLSRVVATFDGIETLFANIKNSVAERIGVEALLRAVPDWLSQIPGRPFGAVVFMREDVARAALPNNFKQFEDRYAAYSLKWNWAEASALAFWIGQQANALNSTRSPIDLVDMDEDLRGRELEPLWGLKMGPNTSREARSQEWVMSSLSDFNRKIKARDLVRFIYEASKRSTDDHSYYDARVLSPRAMRDSIDPCSRARVDETGEENAELQIIFNRIKQLTHGDRELPWTLERAVSLLGTDSVKILEENGILFRDNDEYYVPEIYRDGLGFFYSGGARRKVVTLMRRAPLQ